MKFPTSRRRRLLLCALAAILFLFVGIFFLQSAVAHRKPPFLPDYPIIDLSPIWEQPRLDAEDYDTLFLQTGLGPSAVDRLRDSGPSGIDHILEVQSAFFSPVTVSCDPLFGPFVKEDHLKTPDGTQIMAPPLADLRPGDILLTYSTHSLGWRHGHAGLVLDVSEEGGSTLEAVLIGTDSAIMDTQHWLDYSNYLVLRLRDMTPVLQEALTAYAVEYLNGVPYRLTSGFWGLKEPEDDAFGVQCSYLVWYAFQHFGYDLDSDGGRLVTVNDLAHSPLLEVVQIYGLDPREWS